MSRITVAICTWNRADLLDQTLTGMRGLRVPEGIEWELLVVNNNSTDHTEAVLDRHVGALPIRRLFEPTPGKSHAANRVLDEAWGELILWTDDDVLVDEGWLESLATAAARHPEASGFGGPVVPWFPVPLDPALAEAFPMLKMGYCGLDNAMDEGPLRADQPVFGVNMAFRTSAVEGIRYDHRLGPAPRPSKLKGRAEISLGGGDDISYVEAVRARGGHIVWVPGMRVSHYVSPERMTLVYLKSLYVEYGRSWISNNGIPTGPSSFGVPRWIVRKWIEAGLRSIALRWTSPRSRSLGYLRQCCYYYGMILECWAASRSRPPRGRPAGGEAELAAVVGGARGPGGEA
jgi:glycosyltransferase involved in cell wall biosynthesis